MNETIVAALARTPVDYLTATATSRTSTTPEGSRYAHIASAAEVIEAVRAADWIEMLHPEVAAPCRAFRSDSLRGSNGMVALSDLPAHTQLVLRDVKGTGRAYAVLFDPLLTESLLINRANNEPSWLILGPHEGDEIVYTFHPGPPAPLSTIDFECDKLITVARAADIGFTHAKLGASPPRCQKFSLRAAAALADLIENVKETIKR